jgi:hypothetical protein
MSQKPHARLEKGHHILADGLTHLGVLVPNGLGLLPQTFLELGKSQLRVLLQAGHHSVQGVKKVDRRRPGGGQILLDPEEFQPEILVAVGLDVLGAQVESKGGGNADGGGPRTCSLLMACQISSAVFRRR